MKWFFKAILKLTGFKVVGSVYNDIKKKVLIVVPHTSNWDFPLGLLVKYSYGIKVNFIGKKSLFKRPFGWFFKALGGIPVDRSKSSNTVRTLVDAYDSREEMTIVMTPEGTRRKVTSLKKGFYYIAKSARVPIIPIKFDFQKKTIDFGEPFYPSDDDEKDLAFFNTYFDGVIGKYPEMSYSSKG